MSYREIPANWLLSKARSFGRSLGCELVVDVSDHSIKTSMEVPNTDKRAWDSNMYHRGQLFRAGYANPIKPVEVLEDDEKYDQVKKSIDIIESGEQAERGEVGMLPSWRYQEHQDQHTISQMVNPTEQWRKILYAVLGLGLLMMMNVVISAYLAGGF